MKLKQRILTWGLAAAAWAVLPGTLLAQKSEGAAESAGKAKAVPVPIGQDNLSFRNEIQLSIDRGLEWLTRNQNSNGWWSTPTHPAITALAVTAFNGDPQNRFRGGKEPEHLKKAYQFILSCAKEDGSIRTTNLFNYNTSISMMALITSNNSEYDPIVRRARQFLLGIQNDFGKKGEVDTPHDGGFGYGTPDTTRSDMINTISALEALYYSKRLTADQPQSGGNDLNWQAAIQFIQTCQNLPSNKEPWVSSNPDDLGGFIYNPGRSDAGGETNKVTGKISLRSYGSVSYAGLLSFIYADVKKDDPRVKAVLEWLSQHYSLEENPGLGKQGLFYYYHTMAKALTAAGISEIQLANGKTVNWRFDLAMKLMELQKRDGSWANDNPRWMEKDSELVTSYVLLALEFLSRSLEG